jgi:TolB protein
VTPLRGRRRVILAVGAACAAAGSVALVAVWWLSATRPAEPSRTHAPLSSTAPSGATAARPAPELGTGVVAFVSERGAERQIYGVRLDGSGLELITSSTAQSYPGPSSPDRRRLLAVTAEEGADGAHREGVALLEPDASGGSGWTSRPLGGPSGRLRNPAWLPDGSGVVLESDAGDFVAIELRRLDGGPAERLTSEPSGSFEPAVRPDGSAIAFVSSADGNPEIYRLELATRQLGRLTWSPGEDGSPVWAPDGAHLAYRSQRRGAFRAYLMGADGTHPRPLLGANDPVDGPDGRFLAHADLAFSPDGSRVALVEQREGRAVLQVVRVADGELLGAGAGRWHDQTPSWSPDGRHIVFASDRNGNVELFVADADGRDPRQLTHSPGASWLPRWLEAPPTGGSGAR